MEEYTNYLAHHGVKGMKWGVRRYQNEDGSRIGAAKRPNKMHTGVSGRINLIRARYAAGTTPALRKRVLGGRAISADYASKYHANKAERARTTLGRMYSTRKSLNYAEDAKTYRAMKQRDLGERAIQKFVFSSTRWNQPYHRISGRTTTIGKDICNKVFTAGLAGVVLDAKYLHKNNTKVRNATNKATSSVKNTGKNMANDFGAKEKALKVVNSPTYKKAATAYANSKVGKAIAKPGVAVSKKTQELKKKAKK